jgi:hypothetical protein
MPPRALWSGSITFGLVNVPVRVYSAVHEHELQFHLVHEPDDGPIGYEKRCKLEDKPHEFAYWHLVPPSTSTAVWTQATYSATSSPAAVTST